MANVVERPASTRVSPCGFSHLALPVRDLEQSRLFYQGVLGGAPEEPSLPGRLRFRFGSFAVEIALQAGGWAQPDAEYPHYGLTVEPQDYLPLKTRLDACGVHTHDPWTRHDDAEALMYFRDPSGNQFEMYCPKGFKDLPLQRGDRAGGNFAIDFVALGYRELGDVASAPQLRPGALAELNHMTIPVRDMQEMKRFLIGALGGELAFELADHITVWVGGAPLGCADRLKAQKPWTGPDVELPQYGFLIRGEDLEPMQQQIQSYGVPTSTLWTVDGQGAHLSFRDPSGNAYDLCAPTGFSGAATLPRRSAAGYEVDWRALSYDRWNDPAS